MSLKRYLIWSNEWHSFWRPNGCGYTTDPRRAGRYTLTEARRHCFPSIRTSNDRQQKDIYLPAPTTWRLRHTDVDNLLERRIDDVNHRLNRMTATSGGAR